MLRRTGTVILALAFLTLLPKTGAAYLHEGICPAPWWWGTAGNLLYRCPLFENPPLAFRHPLPEYSGSPDDPDAAGRWYYCRRPHGYYPRVRFCPGGWSTVSTPPPEEEDEFPEYYQEEE